MPVRSDYLLRLIQQLAQVVARLMGLRQAGRLDEATQLLDESCRQFFGLPLRLTLALSTPDLMMFLKDKYGSTLGSAVVLSELLVHAGDVARERGADDDAVAMWSRALAVLDGARTAPGARAEEMEEAARHEEELRRRLAGVAAPPDSP